jgi:Domain of unknown function (DUF4145)
MAGSMATTQIFNAREILSQITDGQGGFDKWTASFVCPQSNCGAFAQHRLGEVNSVGMQLGARSGHAGTLATGWLKLAFCTLCDGETIWAGSRLIWPTGAGVAPPPSVDMPSEVLAEYEEAGLIAEHSPRGAAALLRLGVEKLLAHLGATNRSIDQAIGQMVSHGIFDVKVQMAADTLRIVGNEAVHPGTMDLKDDISTVMALFRLMNYLVERTITQPREIANLFDSLPEGKKQGVANRDA